MSRRDEEREVKKFEEWMFKFVPCGIRIVGQDAGYMALAAPEYSDIGLAGKQLLEKAVAELKAFRPDMEVSQFIAVGETVTEEEYREATNAAVMARRRMEYAHEGGLLGIIQSLGDIYDENDIELEHPLDIDPVEWYMSDDDDEDDDEEELDPEFEEEIDKVAHKLAELFLQAMDEED